MSHWTTMKVGCITCQYERQLNPTPVDIQDDTSRSPTGPEGEHPSELENGKSDHSTGSNVLTYITPEALMSYHFKSLAQLIQTCQN
jgi:hypothetical protein